MSHLTFHIARRDEYESFMKLYFVAKTADFQKYTLINLIWWKHLIKLHSRLTTIPFL